MEETMEKENELKRIDRMKLKELKEDIKDKEKRDIEFLSDVRMELKIELGRTTKNIKEILSLDEGSVVKLEKIAGENADILFNDKVIAKGEVVLVDESYGVRITTFKNKN
jgi:flagellar motor switch protein FliN/FliY